MTTAYTSLLGLALPVTGELSGTWGDTVNTAITSLLDTAVAGTTSITTDADITLTTTTGASNQARQAIILWNPASGTVTRNITAPAQSKIYTVINASGGTQSIVIRGVGPTTGVTIAKGESATVAWNGSDFVKVGSSGGAITFTDLTVTGNTILGDAAADTLTVNATSTFAAPVNFQGLVKLPSTGRSAAAALTVTAPAFLYGVASTYTDTTSSGTVAAMAPFYSIAQPTLSTSNVTTYTSAATLYLANAPTTGGSATITNPYSLYVAAGNAYFGGALNVGTAPNTGAKVYITGGALASTPAVTGIAMSGGLTTGRLVTQGATELQAIHSFYDASALEISQGSTGAQSGIVINGPSTTNNPSTLQFFAAGAERGRFSSTGNFGVGVSSPASRIDALSVGDTTAGSKSFQLIGGTNIGTAASMQYGLYVSQAGARYTDQTALYALAGANAVGTTGTYGQQYYGVQGVVAVTDQAGQKGSGVYGINNVPTWNYNRLNAGVQGLATGASTTFSNQYALDSTTGAFGGHFVSHGKANSVGVYADAYLDASPGAGAVAYPFIAGSNGTFLLTLDTSGNVTLPKLALSNDTPFYTGANINSGSNALGIGTTGAAQIGFFTSNAERARIASNGNFFIGTTAFTTKLNVAGVNASTGTTVNADSAMMFLYTTDSTANAGPELAFGCSYDGTNSITGAAIKSFKVPGAGAGSDQYDHGLIFKVSKYPTGIYEAVRISKDGYFGVNTTSPNFFTHISTGSTSSITQPTAGSYGLYIQQNTSGSTGGLYIQDGASNSGNSIFVGDNNGAARFVVNQDGYVGIGTSSPASALDVRAGNNAQIAQFDSTAANGGYIAFSASGTNKGYMGLGSNLITGAALADLCIATNAGSNLIFNAGGGGTERARFDSSGNFLIGVTSVSGNGNFTNGKATAVLSAASGAKAWSSTQTTSPVNNTTVDVWLPNDGNGGNSFTNVQCGYFVIYIRANSAADGITAIYSIVTVGNGTTGAVLTQVSATTRGTNPVTTFQLAAVSGGSVKLQAVYNNSGVISGGACTVSFVGLGS
jgi:hypothetical protein